MNSYVDRETWEQAKQELNALLPYAKENLAALEAVHQVNRSLDHLYQRTVALAGRCEALATECQWLEQKTRERK
jgi:hypothetical protein